MEKLAKLYTVEIKKTGDILAICYTIDEAEAEISRQEQEDHDNDQYTDNYYAIYKHIVDLGDGELL